MTTLSKRLCLTALLALSSFAFAASATAETSKLIIESGDSAQSRQNAAMDKEQWNDTRSLRQKVNKRAEKEWDKEDVATSHVPASARLCARTSEGWLPCKPLLALSDDDTERLRAPVCTSVESDS